LKINNAVYVYHRKVDLFLTRKFAKQVEPLYQMNQQAFMEYWRSCFKGGEYAAAFWAAASRRDLSAAARREIFGAVHMSMHATTEEQVTLKRRIDKLQHDKIKHAQKASVLVLTNHFKGFNIPWL
jgi:hypothetical protein